MEAEVNVNFNQLLEIQKYNVGQNYLFKIYPPNPECLSLKRYARLVLTSVNFNISDIWQGWHKAKVLE